MADKPEPLPIPYSEDAEKALLGSMLIDPPIISEVAGELIDTDFYAIQNQWIFRKLVMFGEQVDFLVLTYEMEQEKIFDEIGGDAYLAEITAAVPTALNFRSYITIVRENSVRRRILNACSVAAQLAFDSTKEIDHVVDKAQAAITEAAKPAMKRKAVSVAQAASSWIEKFDAMMDSGTIPGISTGIQALDRMTGGLKAGKFYVIAGKPGSGKTTLMLNCILNAARIGKFAAMFSCEMSEEEMVEVCIANIVATRYPDVNLNAGAVAYMPPAERAKMRQFIGWAQGELMSMPLALRAYPGMSPAQFQFECRALIASRDLKLAAADYIQIMSPPSLGREANREREISSISGALKQTAMSLMIPIMAGSQVNDSGEVRESRSIKADADTLMVLSSENPPALDVDVSKNRAGPTNKIELFYRKSRATIGDTEKISV